MDGSQDVAYERYQDGRWEPTSGAVPQEARVRLHVNGQEWTSLMCTPRDLDWLALGFLRSEGIIRSISDVRLLKVCPSNACVEVWLRDANVELPTAGTITSGCGGGVTFADLSETAEEVVSDRRATAQGICSLVQALQEASPLYRRARGVHAAALADSNRLLAVAEDVGRHNAVDKVWGCCLTSGIGTRDGILVCTGRISSEMLVKAARMGAAIVASRTSPTSLSVALAERWNVTLVGYVRRDALNVYAGRERVSTGKEELHADT